MPYTPFSSFSSQYVVPISPYIAAPAVRCSLAYSGFRVRR